MWHFQNRRHQPWERMHGPQIKTCFNFCENSVKLCVLYPGSCNLPFCIRCATSVPLGKGTKFALHHGKLSTTKRRAIQILHISMLQFTFKRGYNDFISKYTDINSLHVTQIDLLHNDTFYSNSLVSDVNKDLCV